MSIAVTSFKPNGLLGGGLGKPLMDSDASSPGAGPSSAQSFMPTGLLLMAATKNASKTPEDEDSNVEDEEMDDEAWKAMGAC